MTIFTPSSCPHLVTMLWAATGLRKKQVQSTGRPWEDHGVQRLKCSECSTSADCSSVMSMASHTPVTSGRTWQAHLWLLLDPCRPSRYFNPAVFPHPLTMSVREANNGIVLSRILGQAQDLKEPIKESFFGWRMLGRLPSSSASSSLGPWVTFFKQSVASLMTKTWMGEAEIFPLVP